LVAGFLDPQVMVNLIGKPEVNGVADAVEQTPGSSEMLLPVSSCV
jgi:hypothetical protein